MTTIILNKCNTCGHTGCIVNEEESCNWDGCRQCNELQTKQDIERYCKVGAHEWFQSRCILCDITEDEHEATDYCADGNHDYYRSRGEYECSRCGDTKSHWQY